MTETNPYTPPDANIEVPQLNRRKATKLAKAGAWMQVLPILGLIVTAIRLSRATSNWGQTMTEEELMNGVSALGKAFDAAVFGFLGGLIGFILLCVAVFGQKKQPRWVWVMFLISSLPAIYMIGMLLLALGRGVG